MTTEAGWALRRNGTCITEYEVSCGRTGMAPFHGCCPLGFECPKQYNRACCPPGRNCTESLIASPEPKCANSTWDLFDNNGYFCCEHSLLGYNYSDWNICAEPESKLPSGNLLSLISAGSQLDSSSTSSPTPATSDASSSTPSSSAAISTSTPDSLGETSSAELSESQQSSTPIGAIVGGVVGGVGGLAVIGLIAWFLIRRKRKTPYNAPPGGSHEVAYEAMDNSIPAVQQLDSTQAIYEVGGGKTRYAHVGEMPTEEAPVELHGDSSVAK